MARPLVVDTARLETAGITLESLAFPTTPPPITAAGSDTASAAINATMPEIESPVLDGLPAVRTALRGTAANIAAAASIYARADRTLGENLMQLRFSVSDATSEGNTTAPQGPGVQGAAALARSAEIPIANAAPATQLSTQLGQLNATMGAVNPLTQSVFQNVESMTKGAPGTGQPGRGSDAVDEESTTEAEEVDGAGAAGGRHASPSAAPVQPLTPTTVSSTSAPLAPAPRPIVP